MMKPAALSFLGLLLSGTVSAQTTLEGSLPETGWFKKLKENAHASVTTQTGSSTNIGKTPRAEAGSFFKVTPTLSKDFTPLDELVVTPVLNGELKRFTEKKASDLGDEDLLEARLLSIYFTESEGEVSVEGGHLRSRTRIPMVDGAFNTTPLLQSYSENDVRVGYLHAGETVEASSSLSFKEQNNDLDLLDRGNRFRNDHTVFALEATVAAKPREKLRVELASKIERRDYQFRPADFSDGAASSPAARHPVLREDAQEYTLRGTMKNSRHELTGAFGVRFVKDRIFGARDARILKPLFSLKSALTDRLKTKVNFSGERAQFANFRSTPELGSRSDLREEWLLKSSLGTEWGLGGNLALTAQWDYSRLVTNFANGTFTDHTVMAGLQWSL